MTATVVILPVVPRETVLRRRVEEATPSAELRLELASVPLAFEKGIIEARECRDCIELFVSGGPRFICFVEKRHAAALGHALVKMGERDA